MSENEARSVVDSTRDDHRHCMQAVSAVEECLDRHPDRPERWIDDLLTALGALRHELREHFSAEEAGPLFSQLPMKHPRLSRPLRSLQLEHGNLLLETEEAIRKAEHLRSAELFELRELNARVQLLIARLRRHEAEENELVLQAYWDEVGVGD